MNMPAPFSVVASTWPRMAWQYWIALGLALVGWLPVGLAAEALAPVRNKTPSEQEKILFFAEAARQSLIVLGKSDYKDRRRPYFPSEPNNRWENVAVLLANGGDSQGAFATAALHPDEEDEEDVYGHLAEAMAQAGDIDGAKKSAERLKKSDQETRNWAQGEIALAEARAGDLKAAKTMLDAPSGPEVADPPVAGLFSALRDGVLAGDSQDRKVLDELLATVPVDKLNPELGRLFALQAICQARANELDQARATLANVTGPIIRSWVLRNIASQQAKAGDPAGARETLAPGAALLRNALALSEAKPEGERNEDEKWRYEYRDRLSRGLANSQVQIGDLAAAKETIDILKQGWRSDQYEPALADLAGIQAKVGDPSRAEEITQLIKRSDTRAKAMGLIAQAQLAKGDTKGARQSLEQALAPLRKIRRERKHLSALCAAPATEATANLDGVAEAVCLINALKPDHQDNLVIEPFQEIAAMVARQQGTSEAKAWVEQQTDDLYTQATYYVTMGALIAKSPSLPLGRYSEDY